jgi:hypothetical protein
VSYLLFGCASFGVFLWLFFLRKDYIFPDFIRVCLLFASVEGDFCQFVRLSAKSRTQGRAQQTKKIIRGVKDLKRDCDEWGPSSVGPAILCSTERLSWKSHSLDRDGL